MSLRWDPDSIDPLPPSPPGEPKGETSRPPLRIGEPASPREITAVSRSTFEIEPQTIFSLATGESVRFGGTVRCTARTWGDPNVGFRSSAELDWHSCRGLGLVRGRKYEFGVAEPVTFETSTPYPTSHVVKCRAPVRTSAAQSGLDALCVVTLRVGPEAMVHIVSAEVRAIERLSGR